MKTAHYVFLVITLLCPVFVYGQDDSAAKETQINKIVIDPGHGGKDPGCVYKNFYEKDITLSIALKLGELVRNNYPDVQVAYTRSTDKYVGVAERGNMANKEEADLFISIHINAAESTAATGTSTYVMGLDKSGQNLQVAMKENDVVIYEEDYSTKYEGYEPGDPTSYIIFSLIQSAHLDRSMKLAEGIQKHFAKELPMRDLGAKQGPFLVLWNTSMPAILTEVGFLSNAKDRDYITTVKGQNAAARSLFNAFGEYKSDVEAQAGVVLHKGQPARNNNDKQVENDSDRQVEKVSGIKFYIQIMTLSNPKDTRSAAFKSYKGAVTEIKTGKFYKYLVGGYAGFDEADRKLSDVRKEFKDAFIVAFDGSEQIKLDEARRRN